MIVILRFLELRFSFLNLWILLFPAESENARDERNECQEAYEIGEERTWELEIGYNGKDSTTESHEQHQRGKRTLLVSCGAQGLVVRVNYPIDHVHPILSGALAGESIGKLCKAIRTQGLRTRFARTDCRAISMVEAVHFFTSCDNSFLGTIHVPFH